MENLERSSRIGFVGLGAMGMGMACSLVKEGFQVKGYDINANAVQSFTKAGGQGVGSVAEATESEILILSLSMPHKSKMYCLVKVGQKD